MNNMTADNIIDFSFFLKKEEKNNLPIFADVSRELSQQLNKSAKLARKLRQ